MMRLWSRMEPDLELQTGGKRVATYAEIHESMHNAARAEGIALPVSAAASGQGLQARPVGEPAPTAGGSDPDIVVKGDPSETAYVQSLSDEEFERYQDMQSWLDGLETSTPSGDKKAAAQTQPATAPNASRVPAPKANKPATPASNRAADDIGALSRRYESHNRDASAISPGTGDAGGKSYGSYQLSSAKGQVTNFLEAEGKHWASEFQGMALYEQSFDSQWRAIAKRDRAVFLDAQTAYIKRTHYEPVVAQIKRVRGVDLNTLSNAVQNAVLSVAVQMGPGKLQVNGKGTESGASLIVSRAVWHTTLDPKDPDYDKQLIDEIYRARTQYAYRVKARDIRLSNDPKRSPKERKTWHDRAVQMQSVIDDRYPVEQTDAEQMLADERAAKKP